MEEFLKKISDRHNGTINITESKWYNGHTYMPLYVYSLLFNANDLNIQFRYEFRQSEFSKLKSIDGGAFGDRHIFEFTTTSNKKECPGFKVNEIGIFKRFISKRKSLFTITSKSQSLCKTLLKNPDLNQIMSFVNIDSEFSPNISGKTKEDVYTLKIAFHLKQIHYDLLENCFQFLIKFEA
ncbi:hypothetical protein V1389_17730 [Flavobacterium rakeshii]|uniref:hypothetical protein n=1 Tax=Flavobacterium rakeshii TaxID=1038845 RepID=UPI002E7B6730|nr:hypothetical protein [Flavobacterium rakeshii]MEE1900190.1 hypothetical protein [Flavobacterium rakeshii]